MKKFLAAVLAATMVVSMAATVSFAAPEEAATPVVFNITIPDDMTATAAAVINLDITADAATTGVKSTFTQIATATATANDDKDAIITLLVAKSATVAGGYKIEKTTAGVKVTAVDAGLTNFGAKPTVTLSNTTVGASTKDVAITCVNGKAVVDATNFDLVEFGIEGPYVEGAGDMVNGVVKPGTTLYYALDAAAQAMAGKSDLIKITLKKGDNSKNIASVKLVEKNFSSALVNVPGATPATIDTTGRQYFIAAAIKDNMKDSEFKVSIDVKLSAKKATTRAGLGIQGGIGTDAIAAGATFAFGKMGKAWINNDVQTSGDASFLAGTGGIMSKPVKNDNNEVIWSNANYDIAKIAFTADSNVAAYYPKVVTRWDNEFYGMHFPAADAYNIEFVGNPTISATARPVLTIYNPFINNDGEYTVDAADLIVYKVVDGALELVADEFTATEDDDGNQVLVTKTRTLGNYVITDAEAVLEVPATPVVDGKPVPNTGR